MYQQLAQTKEDRKYLEARARRLLKGYLSADTVRKQRYYEVISGAAAACEPSVSNPSLENTQLAQTAAEAVPRPTFGTDVKGRCFFFMERAEASKRLPRPRQLHVWRNNILNVQSLLNTLTVLRAVRWAGATNPAYGVDKPQMTITFTTSPDDKAVHKLFIGAANAEGMWFARTDEKEGMFVMSNPDFTAFKLPLVAAPSPSPAASPAGTPSPVATASPTP